MHTKDTCGPAFPINELDGDGEFLRQHNGISIRDYFAAKAMQGMLSAAENYQTPKLAMYAYEVADAMLAARKD